MGCRTGVLRSLKRFKFMIGIKPDSFSSLGKKIMVIMISKNGVYGQYAGKPFRVSIILANM